jgi:flagellar assembly protein FliH
MSSKVLLREGGQGGIQSMVWRTSGMPGPGVRKQTQDTGAFQPAVSLDPETTALRNRLVEMEYSARQALDAGKRQAFAEGEAQGRTEASAELQPVLNQLAKALDELSSLRPRLREEAESDVVQLSLAIARRVLHRELSIDPGAIQALIQVALGRLARQEIYRVRIHPAQETALRVALAAHHSGVEIQTDARLESGSLIFETNRGKMDASVVAQLEEIERGLTDRVPNR